jgi:hypothetical protein
MPQFRVHAPTDAGHRPLMLDEESPEAAALAYVDDFPHSIDDNTQLRVIVRDCDSGHDHCFTLDLDTGDASPC